MIVRMRHTRGKLSALLYTTRRCLSVAPTIANGSLSLCHLAPTNSAGSFVSCRTAVLSSQQRYKSSLPSSHVDDDDDDEMTKNAIPFPLADIGEGIAEVELMQWFVTPGDTVSQFDPICQVQSDKATVEITSRFDGVILSLEGQTGDMIQVGQPLLWIQTNQPAVSPSPTTTTAMDPNTNQQHQDVSPPDYVSAFQEQEPTEAPPTAPPTQASIDGKTKVLATPAVRKIAMDNAIDLSTIVGSGPNGRILKADLLHLSKQHSNTGEDTEMSIATSVDDKPQDPSVVPIRGYNRLMVKTMTESLNIPHMGYGDDIDMTPLLEHKKQLEASSSLCSTSRLSVLAFSVKALSLALTQYPTVNSSINIDEMTLTIHQDHNVGLAMDTPRGLAVPVVRNCQNLSIAEITEEINRLKSQGQEGSLAKEDLVGATITLSNIGSIGGTHMSPIIASPQVAIGAMGRIQRLPRFVNSDSTEVEEAYIMSATWAGDHRALDGATLAQFAQQWKNYMENPVDMLLRMR